MNSRSCGCFFFFFKSLICLVVLHLKCLDSELLVCSQYLEGVGKRAVVMKFHMLILVEIPLEKENSSTIRESIFNTLRSICV